MCEMASFVITSEKIFWSKKTDSHEEIIREFGIQQDGIRGPNIMRVEVVPPRYNYLLPINKWVYKTDQDIIPEWYEEEKYKPMVMEYLRDWVAQKIITADCEKTNGNYIVVSGRVILRGSSSAVLWGSSSAELRDSSSAELWGSSSAVDRRKNITVIYYANKKWIAEQKNGKI